MYELNNIIGNSYYIQSPAKVGLVKLGADEVCLIDSGSDKEAGRKIRQVLDANKWKLTAIYNTHSNADHIGGNSYLQRQTGCKIFAKGVECDFTRHPILEPCFLYGGFPPKELKHKSIMAKESDAQYLTEDCLPDGLEMISLPGHFMDMVGFRTADDVVYLADCLFSKETIEKYKISFIFDVKAFLETLETVKTMSAKMFVPSHGEVTENICDLAQFNIDNVWQIGDKIVDIVKEPMIFEDILQRIFEAFDLNMTIEQYALVGSTVKSYMSWLKEEGKIDCLVSDNRLLWERV